MNKIYDIRLPIFCIGDSHSSFFAGINEVQRVWPTKAKHILPFFRAFPIGQALAYNLIKLNSTTKGREKLFSVLRQEVPIGANIMLCFGEIDCRAHLIKQSKSQGKNINAVVKECVDRYFTVILEIQKLGYKVIVWNVIPSTRFEKIGNNIYPVIGSCRERNLVTSTFNKILQQKCKKNNISFLSTYKYFIDSTGLTNMWYYMDGIHLSQRAMPITLRVISNELKVRLRLPIYQQVKYKTINFCWDSYIWVRYWRRSLFKKLRALLG